MMSFLNCFSSSSDKPPPPPPEPPEIRIVSPAASRMGSIESLQDDPKPSSNLVITAVSPEPASSMLLDYSEENDDILITKRGSGEVLVLTGALTALEQELEKVENAQAIAPEPNVKVSSPKRQSTKRTPKKTSKKMYFLWSLMAYCVICGLFFIANAIIMVVIGFRKMHYFIREPDKQALFDVVPNVKWILLKSLLGCLLHILLAIFTFCVLVGVRKTEAMVTRYKEKIMIWLLVLACIGEFLMLFSTLDHMSSSATVENGQAKDTLLPQGVQAHHYKCFSNNDFSHQTIIKDTIIVQNQVRANLKWMVQISCGTSTSNHVTHPTWKFILDRIFHQEFLRNDSSCSNLKEKLVRGASSDCSVLHFLDANVYAWLIVDGLGIWFCLGIAYLQIKSFVRMKPGRFSFADSTYLEDIEALKEVAGRLKRMAQNQDQKSQRSNRRRHRRTGTKAGLKQEV